MSRTPQRFLSPLATTLTLAIASPAVAQVSTNPQLPAELVPIERGSIPPIPAVTWHPEPAGVSIDTVAVNLEIISKIAVAPDGRLFVAERPGRLRVVDSGGSLVNAAWLNIVDNIYLSGESGLTGLALHPDFASQPYVYVMYSIQGVEGYPFDRVSRYREQNGAAGPEEVIVDSLPAAKTEGNNRGGHIAFGPDGMLYIGLGDNFQRRAGDPDTQLGKILRVTPEGDVPADNPTRGSRIWASGFRNPHGFAWNPATGQLFVADHGPTGEDNIRGYDRVIAVQKGGQHGWPDFAGAPGNAAYVDPIVVFEETTPPGDLVFHNGALYMTVLGFSSEGAQDLIRIELEGGASPRVSGVQRWFNDAEGNSLYGRLRGLAVGPDGSIYVGTSNRDYRSDRRGGDDKILKLRVP